MGVLNTDLHDALWFWHYYSAGYSLLFQQLPELLTLHMIISGALEIKVLVG